VTSEAVKTGFRNSKRGLTNQAASQQTTLMDKALPAKTER
jgi:hypothetical protein